MERAESFKRSAATLKPIADYAQSNGIIIVIDSAPKQYPGDGRELAELAIQMDHPALRLMPDFGKMKLDDPYGESIAMMPYSEVASAKSHEFTEDGMSRKFDYPRSCRVWLNPASRVSLRLNMRAASWAQLKASRPLRRSLKSATNANSGQT